MNAIISSPAVKRSFYLLAIAVVSGLLVLADLLASYRWFAALELTRVVWTLRLLTVGLVSGSFLLI
jgi:hypothetical protein